VVWKLPDVVCLNIPVRSFVHVCCTLVQRGRAARCCQHGKSTRVQGVWNKPQLRSYRSQHVTVLCLPQPDDAAGGASGPSHTSMDKTCLLSQAIPQLEISYQPVVPHPMQDHTTARCTHRAIMQLKQRTLKTQGDWPPLVVPGTYRTVQERGGGARVRMLQRSALHTEHQRAQPWQLVCKLLGGCSMACLMVAAVVLSWLCRRGKTDPALANDPDAKNRCDPRQQEPCQCIV
jgi:hypothetical protein